MVSFLVRWFLKYWLPVLAWMLFIFIGSTDLLSAEHTSRFIAPFLRWLAPNVSDATVASVQLVVRKCAHLAEYAILTALFFRAFRQLQRGLGRAFAIGFLSAALYAVLDEFHQSFVASRTASPWDVLIDCAGALAGASIYWRMIRDRKSTMAVGAS
ncbi:MAG: VanZ family protein [Verrucomicrobiota bacterium]|nr:VanZ family protein [Verrucomicrobiota bacterium]